MGLLQDLSSQVAAWDNEIDRCREENRIRKGVLAKIEDQIMELMEGAETHKTMIAAGEATIADLLEKSEIAAQLIAKLGGDLEPQAEGPSTGIVADTATTKALVATTSESFREDPTETAGPFDSLVVQRFPRYLSSVADVVRYVVTNGEKGTQFSFSDVYDVVKRVGLKANAGAVRSALSREAKAGKVLVVGQQRSFGAPPSNIYTLPGEDGK